MQANERWDCLVVGGGPAGLTAALYLARFRRHVLVIDADRGRAATIPLTHNFPGFPDGISGQNLLARMREQVRRYGAVLQEGSVDSLGTDEDGFTATAGGEPIHASSVILTTGVQDRDSGIPDVRAATLNGSVRWCPVCDGYEVIDQNVALLASTTTGLSHALFLRTYTRDLTLFFSPDDPPFSTADRQELTQAGIRLVSDPIEALRPTLDGRVEILLATGRKFEFDTLYPMMGHETQSALATTLGAQCDEDGELVVDGQQETSVPGLYAAGDVVNALNQMTVGMAHAATAATAVHNRLGRNLR